jgi:proline iminopeptidase
LAYAQAHPEPVTELVLRGIFLFRKKEIDWFYRDGTRRLFPDLWEEFIAPIPEDERDNIIAAYYRRLTGPNEAEKIVAAKAWCLWENRTITLSPDDALASEVNNVSFALAFARIEAHYFINGGFIAHENQLLEDCSLIRHIPTIIVHGRYDAICPCANAWDLKQALPQADLRIIPASGHSAFEPGITGALVEATDHFLEAMD